MMKIPTSDLPILLSDTVYAEVWKACAEKEDRKRKSWVYNDKDSNLRP